MPEHQHDTAHDFDMTPHEQTWKVFNRIVVWGMVLVIAILLFLLWIHWMFGRL